MKTNRASFLLFPLLPLLAAACASPADDPAGEDPDMTESEIGTKPPPRDVTWQALSLPRAGLEGDVSIDDIAFVKRPDGSPVTKDNGKPIMFVIERIGMKRLPGVENGQLGPLVDPGVALLLRSDDGGDTFSLLSQLPGLGIRAHLHLAAVPRGGDVNRTRIYVNAPSDDTGMRGGPLSFHGALMRSDDGGWSFTSLAGDVGDIELEASNPDVMTGIDCRGIVKSNDGGASWAAITVRSPAPFCEGAHLVRTKDPNRFYAVYGLGDFGMPYLFRSDDAGKSFSMSPDPVDTYAKSNVVADPLDANHVWAWDNRGFASSADGAKNFAPHNRGLIPNGNPELTFSLSNLVVDDLHQPPGQEKHALWFGSANRLVRWTPSNGPEGGDWKQVASLPGNALRFEIAGRGSSPRPYAVVRSEAGSEVLLRGVFAYAR